MRQQSEEEEEGEALVIEERETHEAIQAVVDAETRAWDEQHAERLVSLFHPDTVWPWPPAPDAHDSGGWVWGMGRFERERWRSVWQELFDTHELVHNRRETVRISVAPDGRGAFAVVDVDTLWRPRDGGPDVHWLGRACKIYTRLGGGWKPIAHTGLLSYPPGQHQAARLLPLPDPPLQDDGIRLRPWTDSDVEPANRATQDPLIHRFTGVPETPTLEQTRAFFDAQPALRETGAELTLAVADRADDSFLGAISLLRFEREARRAEIGYWVAPWARGRGAATAAVRLLSHWALHELELARLALHTHPDNVASQRVAEHAGFTREGTLRAFDTRGEQPRDIVVFSLIREDVERAASKDRRSSVFPSTGRGGDDMQTASGRIVWPGIAAEAGMLIRRPVADVFEAFVDPEVTTRFWFTRSTGKLEEGKRVHWDWEMYGQSADVEVDEVVENERIVLGLPAYEGEGRTTAVWRFTPHPEGTYVEVASSGFSGDAEAVARQAVDATGGFTLVLAGMKAWLEHRAELGLVRDRFPAAVEH